MKRFQNPVGAEGTRLKCLEPKQLALLATVLQLVFR